MKMNRDYLKAKEFKKKIEELNIEIEMIKNTNDVRTLTADEFIFTFDKNKLRAKQIELSLCKLNLSVIKYRYFLASKKTVMNLLEEYEFYLKEELAYLKNQKSIRKSNRFILDYNKIHQLESHIKSEKNIYICLLKQRFNHVKKISKMLRDNVIVVILSLLIIGSPLVFAAIASTPSESWVQDKSDWIGFWGNYIGGSMGAIIGGVIAYNIAKKGFNEQRTMDRENHIVELKVEKLSEFVTCLVTLEQKLTLHKAYIDLAYDKIKSIYAEKSTLKEIKFDSNIFDISNFLEIIQNNHENIFDQLEKYKIQHEVISYLVYHYEIIINNVYSNILNLLSFSNKFEDLFKLCGSETFTPTKRIEFEGWDEAMKSFISINDSVDYELYLLKTNIRNEMSSELNLAKSILESKEDFLEQRHL